jgi:hypothetical protein
VSMVSEFSRRCRRGSMYCNHPQEPSLAPQPNQGTQASHTSAPLPGSRGVYLGRQYSGVHGDGCKDDRAMAAKMI